MMNQRVFSKIVALFLFVLLLGYGPMSFACGPFTLTAVFSFTVHPEYPLDRYASGEIGVLQPTYARSYLYAAYRQLAGTGFNAQEQQALVSLWKQRLEYHWDDGASSTEVWTTARKKVPNIAAASEIEVYRSREKPNEYEQYLNCASDAFENASATLNARIEKFGADSALVRDWVAAQDEVFANCSSGVHIPAPASREADALVRSDRDYQIAAANFYAGVFSEAEKQFTAIARDNNSPWHSAAPYLLARTFVREASIGAPERRNDAHDAAEKQLNSILKNPAIRDWHAAASRLLNIVLLRHRPEERLQQLGKSLLTKNNDSLKQELWDYTVLMDQFIGDDSEGEDAKEPPFAIRQDELTDWIITFQQNSPTAAQHARQQWQTRRSLPWLVAALAKATSKEPATSDLVAAGAKVGADSPAFATVSFHTVRLMMDAGRTDQARSKLDELLQKHRSQLTVSGANQLESQRMLLATDLQDFLKHAQQTPAAFSWDDDGREIPTDDSEQSEETKSLRGKPMLDADAAQLMNRWFPISLWREAAMSDVLSPRLHRDVAQAAWLRAVLLGDGKTAEELVPTLKTQLPELTGPLDDYLAAKQTDARKFTAIYLWLKFPGLEPVADVGIGRQSKPAEQDSYRDNWWCSAAFPPTAEMQQYEAARRKPTFLTSQQQAAGKAEAAKLEALGAAPNYLAREVIQWATKAPSDSRVPEALHLAVKSTRFGCTDKDSARWSKAAFDLLHKRFPRNVWAKRTPYWFKD